MIAIGFHQIIFHYQKQSSATTLQQQSDFRVYQLLSLMQKLKKHLHDQKKSQQGKFKSQNTKLGLTFSNSSSLSTSLELTKQQSIRKDIDELQRRVQQYKSKKFTFLKQNLIQTIFDEHHQHPNKYESDLSFYLCLYQSEDQLEEELKEKNSRQIIRFILMAYKIMEKAIQYRNKQKGNLLGKLDDQQYQISHLVRKIKSIYLEKLINFRMSEKKFNNIFIVRRLEKKIIQEFYDQLVKRENLVKRVKQTQRRISIMRKEGKYNEKIFNQLLQRRKGSISLTVINLVGGKAEEYDHIEKFPPIGNFIRFKLKLGENIRVQIIRKGQNENIDYFMKNEEDRTDYLSLKLHFSESFL